MAFKAGKELMPRNADGTVAYSNVHFTTTWPKMEECVTLGLTRSIGVSNFNSKQVDEILSIAKIRPVTNQVKNILWLIFGFYKLGHAHRLSCILISLKWSCKSSVPREIWFWPVILLWVRPTGPGPKLETQICCTTPESKRSPTSTANRQPRFCFAIRYVGWIYEFNILIAQFDQIERGVIVIPKSVTKSRIQENFQIFNFKLSPEEVSTLTSMDCNGRLCPLDRYLCHNL